MSISYWLEPPGLIGRNTPPETSAASEASTGFRRRSGGRMEGHRDFASVLYPSRQPHDARSNERADEGVREGRFALILRQTGKQTGKGFGQQNTLHRVNDTGRVSYFMRPEGLEPPTF